MNTLQKLGALFFEEQYAVPVRTANNLATVAAAAPSGSGGFTPGSLVEVLERMCEQRVVQALDDSKQSVVTSQVALVHRAPALPGAQLYVRAWVQRVGWDVVTFELEVRDRFKLLCEGTLTLALQRVVQAVRAPLPIQMPRQAPRRLPVLGLFSPAMAGRVLPVLLWCMASVLLVAATLLALAPNLEQRAGHAAAQQQDRLQSLQSAITVEPGAMVPLSHPLAAPGAGNTEAPAHGG
jgi:predicted thioesterase